LPPKSFGGGVAETALSPIVVVVMILAIILILVLPRKYVIVPLILVTFLVPVGQVVVLGGVHLFVCRIIILFGCIRLLVTKMTSQDTIFAGGFNSVDRAFMWCTIIQGVSVILLVMQEDAAVNRVGFLLDFLGGYFLVRFLIQDQEDIMRALKCLAFLSLVLGICMIGEHLTMHNVFGYIGGKAIPDVREGRIRSQGSFSHELLAGAFGATLVPLFLLLWKSGKAKVAAVTGLVGATLLTVTSNSSTSLSTFAAGVFAACLWPLRGKMRRVRWGIVFGLIALQLVMKAPVWFVIAHVDLVGGSSNWHRAAIVDQFIRHFSDWWLLGTKDTSSWGWDMWDTQNEYVSVGQSGGLIAFVFFIAIISRSFGRLGAARKAVAGDREREWFLWFLGAALFAHVVAFFGVNYFDQTRVAWFILLAMISAVTAPILQKAAVPELQAPPAFDGSRLRYGPPLPSSPIAGGLATKRSRQFGSGFSK
jgi:hypothetical protein